MRSWMSAAIARRVFSSLSVSWAASARSSSCLSLSASLESFQSVLSMKITAARLRGRGKAIASR